jgi:hypothetical protein
MDKEAPAAYFLGLSVVGAFGKLLQTSSNIIHTPL